MQAITQLKQVLEAGYVVEFRDGSLFAYLNDPEHPGFDLSKSHMGTRVGNLSFQIDSVWRLAFGYPEDGNPTQRYIDMQAKRAHR